MINQVVFHNKMPLLSCMDTTSVSLLGEPGVNQIVCKLYEDDRRQTGPKGMQ